MVAIGVKRKLSIVDLGVVFNAKMTFNDHVDYVVARAYSLLGLLKLLKKLLLYALGSLGWKKVFE